MFQSKTFVKNLLTALGLIIIIGTDCGIRFFNDFNSYEVVTDISNEKAPDSESKEKSEKKLKDYVGNDFSHLATALANKSDKLQCIEFLNKPFHSHWDEIPYPPPEFV